MRTKDLYTDFADFAQYVDGLTADTTLEQLQPSIRMAASMVAEGITADAFNEIVKAGPNEQEDIDPYEELRTAVASYAMLNYQIFSTVKKNGSDSSIYKYQHEEMKKHYLEAFFSAADELFSWLDAHPETGKFNESEQFKIRQELPIRSAKEFERYFQIGNSAYFFSQILYIIRDCWGKIKPVIRDCEDAEVIDLAKKSCCYDVMAKVVMTFDSSELPKSIRLDTNHEFTKENGMADRKALSSQYSLIAKEAMSTLQARLRKDSGTSALDDRNKESDKFVML